MCVIAAILNLTKLCCVKYPEQHQVRRIGGIRRPLGESAPEPAFLQKAYRLLCGESCANGLLTLRAAPQGNYPAIAQQNFVKLNYGDGGNALVQAREAG